MPARCMPAGRKTRHHAPDPHDKSLKLPPFVLSKNLTLMVVVEPGIKLPYAALLVNYSHFPSITIGLPKVEVYLTVTVF